MFTVNDEKYLHLLAVTHHHISTPALAVLKLFPATLDRVTNVWGYLIVATWGGLDTLFQSSILVSALHEQFERSN